MVPRPGGPFVDLGWSLQKQVDLGDTQDFLPGGPVGPFVIPRPGELLSLQDLGNLLGDLGDLLWSLDLGDLLESPGPGRTLGLPRPG